MIVPVVISCNCTSTGFAMSTEKKKHLMKIHFQHTFIQGIFTKLAIVSSYDFDLQLYATLSDIRNN